MSDLEQDVERLQDAMRNFFKAFKRPQQWARLSAITGISLDQPSALILRTLIVNEPRRMRVQDLAHELGIESPSVTRKTQLLEELGYLQRQPDAVDKRAISLHVTDSGREVAAKLWQAQRQDIIQVLSRWPEQQRQQFVESLDQFSLELLQETTQDNKRKD